MDTAAGREFHHQVVDGLDPHHLVALGGRGELAALLRPFRRRPRPRIHELEIPPGLESRSRERRRAYRRRRLRSYFRDAGEERVGLGEIGCHGHVPAFGDPDAWQDLLVGLLDRRGYLLRAGVIRSVEEGPELVLRAPDFDTGDVGSVQFGSMRVDFL